jgi:hypothetical protein
MDWQLDLLDHNRVTLCNYKLVQRYRYFTHTAIHYIRPQHKATLRSLHCRIRSPSQLTCNPATLQHFSGDCYFTVDSRLGYWYSTQLCHQLYSRGTRLFLLLRHMVFTVPLLRAHALPSKCCVILVTRHTLLLCGRLATVVSKRHIAFRVHVTSTVAWSPSNGCKQTP